MVVGPPPSRSTEEYFGYSKTSKRHNVEWIGGAVPNFAVRTLSGVQKDGSPSLTSLSLTSTMVLPREDQVIGTLYITDHGWYEFLRDRPDIGEVNFWIPSARRTFRAPEFSPFLFKLRAPNNAICGFGYFARYVKMPDWLAWDCFGQGNGSETFPEMQDRIRRLREGFRYEEEGGLSEIGCIIVVEPVFFPPEDWVPQPSDWKYWTQTSKKYELSEGEGRRVWEACLERGGVYRPDSGISVSEGQPVENERYGAPQIYAPRLGQGTFRVLVTEAYGRACAVTGEHSLPALDAAHIRPFSKNGPHEVRNGLLLRADLHRLFDQGYLTVTPELCLEVRKRLRADYDNGRTYYPLHGAKLRNPAMGPQAPANEYLQWHNEKVFLS